MPGARDAQGHPVQPGLPQGRRGGDGHGGRPGAPGPGHRVHDGPVHRGHRARRAEHPDLRAHQEPGGGHRRAPRAGGGQQGPG